MKPGWMDYYVHRVIREGEERRLQRKHTEARWLREARELGDASRGQPARGSLAGRLVALLSGWRTRELPGMEPGRVRANVTAAAKLAVPVAALAIGELDGAAIGNVAAVAT